MIEFNQLNQTSPYIIFKKKYDEALNAGQRNIEAIHISSYNKNIEEVDARIVNLKFINNDNFIFFSNYNSSKSIAFGSYDQISALFFWSATNVQIRMKAKIKRTSAKYNKQYFKNRSLNKNALAISSKQSKEISSYTEVMAKYMNALKLEDLTACPDYWGGFSFTPFYFEFWEGDEYRVNKRKAFTLVDGDWQKTILQP
jgi:pyridoxamine 5'-phosphate oxidase